MMMDAQSQPIHLGSTRTVAPTEEPFSDSDVKLWLRVTDNTEDVTIEALIKAARQKVEDDTGLALLSQTYTVSVDRVPSVIVLPVGPVQSVSSIKSFSTADAESTVSPTVYRVDVTSLPARVVLKDGQAWPTGLRPQNGLLVTYVAGWATKAEMPPSLVMAMRLLIEHWFAHRGAVAVGTISQEIALTYRALTDQYRLMVMA